MIVDQMGSANNLALATGISASSIGKYLTGVADPSRKRLIKIAEVGQVKVSWLITGEGK